MRSNSELFTIHDENIIQIRVPVPLALKTVNSYLLKDGQSYVWIDPGLNTKDIQKFWTHIFTSLNIKPTQINKIICTHQHPDHFGLAGYAQQITGAPVYISKQAFAYASLLWAEDSLYPAALEALFTNHSVPKLLINEIIENLFWFKTLVYPFPNITIMNEADSFNINNDKWSCIETSGHAKGQMMLFNESKHILICGDQVLPHITPHVGVVPTEEDELPLLSFFDCLERIKVLSVSNCYAGHGESFTNWQQRIESIMSHHQRRLVKLLEVIEQRLILNAFDASNYIFGEHLHKQPQNLRFAITEMIAHLDYLCYTGKLTKKQTKLGHITYHKN